MSIDTTAENKKSTQLIPSPFESPVASNTSIDTKSEGEMSPAELVIQTHGFMERFSHMSEEKNLPNTIFFLDKSARPVAYLFKKLFKHYCPNQEIPQIRYINIGKSGGTSTSFNSDPQIIADTYGKYINREGSILVVDEVSKTGKTLDTAKDFLSRAFPDASVSGMTAYTMDPEWYRDQSKEELLGVEDVPLSRYREIALGLLNEELGTTYESIDELPADSEERRRYAALNESIVNSIPHAQGSHPRSWPTRRLNSLSTMLRTRKFFSEGKTNSQNEFRKKLDEVYQTTIEYKKGTSRGK